MQPHSLVVPAEDLRGVPSRSVLGECDAHVRLESALTAVREAFTQSTACENAVLRPDFRVLLRSLAREVTRQVRPNRHDAWVTETLSIIKAVTAAGGYDWPASGGDLAEAGANLGRGWAGVVAAMLQAPSWELLQAPSLESVPNWLWSEYAAWLYSTPPHYAQLEGELFAEVRVKRLQDLEHWVRRNPGAASVKAAMDAYLDAERIPFYPADATFWRQHAEVRGAILAHRSVRNRLVDEPAPVARHGRRLRVGFVARDFGPRAEIFGHVPCFEQLDAKAFEVFLFPLTATGTAEEAYCGRRVRGMQLLPPTGPERLELLRRGRLDVLVFVGELGRDLTEVTELALHRIAPLQVVNSRSGLTTGLPEIDLYVTGEELPAAAFSERLGLLRGPAHSVSFARSAASNDEGKPSRADLGLPAAGTIIATVVDAAGVTSAVLQEWCRLLATSPEAQLAVAFLHEGDVPTVARFCQAVARALEVHGLPRHRVTVFPAAPGRAGEVRTLLGASDLYLDSRPVALAGWAAAEALQAGLPVAAQGGSGGQPVASMLSALGLAECVAPSAATLVEWVAGLSADADRRAALRARIAAAVETAPDFLDTLAASDAFGALIEAAFDEVCSLGRAEFRRQTEPVRCFGLDDATETIDAGFAAMASGDLETATLEAALALRSDPRNPRARYLFGQVQYSQGGHGRAVDYLLAAVQQPDATPAMWYALALALRDNRQLPEAIQVLETCLRLEPGNVEVLLTLLELAERVGATEIARDVLQCLQQSAPDDPRVLAMS